MYALAINGSPRKGGNTETMLTAALEPLKKAGWRTEVVQIGGKPLRGCMACFKCFENRDRRCSMTIDGLNEVLAKMFEADAIILGSPTYFTDVTAEMKALIDRGGLVSMANGRALRGKIGAGVVAVRRGGSTHVLDSLNHLFLISGMVVPGSTYWNMGFGHEEKGEVARDEEGMANMRDLGRMIGWLGKAIAAHRDELPRLEQAEPEAA